METKELEKKIAKPTAENTAMKMLELLRIELGESVDVGNVSPVLLNAYVADHRATYAGDDDDECTILVHYTKEAIAENRQLLEPMLWRFSRSTINGRWMFDYIE